MRSNDTLEIIESLVEIALVFLALLLCICVCALGSGEQ